MTWDGSPEKAQSVFDYFNGGSVDLLLVQPPVFPPGTPVDGVGEPIVRRYWELLYSLDERLSDQITEPNIGLLTVASAARRAGLSVQYVDLHILDLALRDRERRGIAEGDIRRALAGWRSPLVGLNAMASNWGWARRTAAIARAVMPEALLALGGVHATLVGGRCLEECPELEVVARGEGEETIVDLASAAQGGCRRLPDALRGIPGTVYRAKDGSIVENPPREEIDLDAVPYPAYDLVPREAYPIVFRVAANRGCSGTCRFCSMRAFWGGRVRRRDPVRVVDEIEHWHRTAGCRRFMMGDLTFMQHPEHSRAVCRELVRRRLPVEWWCQVRSGELSREDAELLRAAGCTQVAFGVEAGDQERLDAVRKNISAQDAAGFCRMLKELGFFVQAYFLLGLPGETLDSALRTVRTIDELLASDTLDVTHISFLVPYPGTELYRDPGPGLQVLSHDYDRYFSGVSRLLSMMPVISTPELDAHRIRALWQLALAVASSHYARRIEARRAAGGGGVARA
ncbi:MAG: B12-binding domain-containing radical SAM protein [Acetobacteraceae bacterium]|nr:B12-binding domain-containing radical SAM protein [Acetobacteraceae bacterium]